MKRKKIAHVIEFQNIMNYSQGSKNTYLHDLKSIYTKVLKTLEHVAKEYVVYGENHLFYPSPPKMSDLAIVSLFYVLNALKSHLRTCYGQRSTRIQQDYG